MGDEVKIEIEEDVVRGYNRSSGVNSRNTEEGIK